MKKFVVAIVSFFENEVKQFKIEADNEYDAVKIAMVDFTESEESKQHELDYQNSDNYPKTIQDLYYDEMDFSVIEVMEF